MKQTWVVVLALFVVVTMCGLVYADCPDEQVHCVKIINGYIDLNNPVRAGEFMAGQCFVWYMLGCVYCSSWDDLARQCTSRFPGECANNTCAACGSFFRPCYDANGTPIR